MGFEVTSFVDEIDKEFVCPICMMVVEKPLESPCEHIFCAKCIVGWITLESTCPVDRQVLNLSDLKAAPRYYRNLWSKLKVKCQMDSLGCESVVPLERLESHILTCDYKPDTIIVCDKGCNLTMTRLEYQKSCVTHLSTYLSNKFNGELDVLKTKIERLNDQVKRQRETMVRIANRALTTPSKLSWKKMYNMNVSAIEPNILEPLNTSRFCWAFVQFTKLEATIPSFRIQVLNITDGEYVVIGLTHNNHFDELPGRRVGSIGYYSRGECVVNGKATFGLEKWKNGDIVECCVTFHPSSLNNQDLGKWAEVSFSINQVAIVKKKMKVPSDGFFPTIRMGSFTSSVPKVEYLTYND